MTNFLEHEIARGVNLLDQYSPGWEAHIDLRRLDMLSCENCVLGQVPSPLPAEPYESNFGAWLRLLFGPDELDIAEWGFDAATEIQYDHLNEEWENFIRVRLDEPV